MIIINHISENTGCSEGVDRWDDDKAAIKGKESDRQLKWNQLLIIILDTS
jgi:hypothetical protein